MPAKTFSVFALSLFYISSFWGELLRALPAPFNQWYRIPYRLVSPWLQRLHFSSISEIETFAIYQTLEAFVFGLLIPILVLHLLNRSPKDAGLRWTKTLGSRWTIVCFLLILPISFWLSFSTPYPWGSLLFEMCEFAAMLPEHFLVFGVAFALMLPTGRLVPPKEPDRRVFGKKSTRPRVTNSKVMQEHEFFSILAAATLFLVIHIGGMTDQEMFASFPIGFLFAYATLRTGSIWPALIAHWGINVIPMTYMAVQKHVLL